MPPVPAARGSLHVLRHPDGRTVAVPIHPGRDVPPGTPRNILRIINMSADDLRRLLSPAHHENLQGRPAISASIHRMNRVFCQRVDATGAL